MGPAGPGSLAQVINAALGNRERFDAMRRFFEDVGSGDKAGVWQGTPVVHADFRERRRRELERGARQRKAQEMV
jgi:chlorophyllide a reductase subunit Y